MANSHIVCNNEAYLNYHPGSLGIPNNNYTKRFKKKNKASENF